MTEELATLRAQLETAKSVHEVETTEFQEIDQLRDTVSSLQVNMACLGEWFCELGSALQCYFILFPLNMMLLK